MKHSNNQQLFKTILFSGISVLLGYIINFLVTPYITETLGVEAYGFVSIADSLVSYAGIVTIAFTTFIVRYISVSYHSKDIQDANEYYSSSILACALVSIVIFIFSLVLIWKLELVLNIPFSLIESVKLLFLFSFLNFVITVITTPYSTPMYIQNRLDLNAIIKIAAKILEACVVVLLFMFLPAKVWFISISTILGTFIIFVFSKYYAKKLTPELHYSCKDVHLFNIKNLVKNGIWNSLNQLGNVLNSGLDLLISNLMLNGIQTGQIAISKNISLIFSTFAQTIYHAFQPELLKTYSEGIMEHFMNVLMKAMKVCGMFGAILFALIVSLGGTYFKLWLPTQDFNTLHILTIIAVFNQITDSILRPVYYVNTLTLKNKVPCWITIVGGILNIVSMYILLKYTNLGAYAVVLTTAIIMIAINLFFNPWYAAKCLNVSSRPFYKLIIKHSIVCIVLAFIFYEITKFMNPVNWIQLIGTAICMSLFGSLIYYFLIIRTKLCKNN